MLHTLDFIMPVQGVIPPRVCDRLIRRFDTNPNVFQRDEEFYSFKELNISQEKEFDVDTEYLLECNKSLIELYRDKVGVDFFPTEYTFEEFRMKKYEPNGEDVFDWHVDVGDYSSARRFLIFLYYINDVWSGGKTIFDWGCNDDKSIGTRAMRGSCTMFPPMWMFPHKGEMAIDGPKYIISSYAHYV